MRIEIRTSGGFAGNVRRPPLVVDTSELEPAKGGRLEQLAAQLPPSQKSPGRGADLMRYDIDVDGRKSSYEEPGAPGEVRELLRLAREAAAQGA